MTGLTGALDIIDCVESDARLRAAVTVTPAAARQGASTRLEDLGRAVLPWDRAVIARFDLAMAASGDGLSGLRAPLMLITSRPGPARGVGPVPAAVLVARDEDALGRRDAAVVGNPCFDRLFASLPWRRRYRGAMGVHEEQELVAVSGTLGPHGLVVRAPELLARLVEQLPPARFRVVALLHPAVWQVHGRRRLMARTRECRRAGLLLPEPGRDWRPYVVAADHVIGDSGVIATYATAIGRPVLRLAPDRRAGLDPDAPLLPQLRAARVTDHGAAVAALTSRPGRAAVLIRAQICRMLGLAPPGGPQAASPVPWPNPRIVDHELAATIPDELRR